jgi:hypothetical protein
MEMGSNLLSGGPLSDGLLIAAVAVLVIARQFMPRQVRYRAMVAVPLIAGYLGLQALAKTPPDGTFAVTLLGANLLAGAVTGLVRGATFRIWHDRYGVLMMQGTALTFACWLVSIALKVALGVAGHGSFAMNEVALFVAVTFGAQNLVVWLRTVGGAAVQVPVRTR